MGTGVFSSDAGYADLPLTLLGAPVETLISLETEKKSSAPETRVRRHNRRIFEYHGVLFLHSCLKLSESCRITGNIQTFIGVPIFFLCLPKTNSTTSVQLYKYVVTFL